MTKQATANEARTAQSARSRSVGKTDSNRKAQTLGIESEGILIVGEDASDFHKFATKIIKELKPVGPVEQEVAERVVVILWRLKRIPRLEASVIAARDAATAENSTAKKDQKFRDHFASMADRYQLKPRPTQPDSADTASNSGPPEKTEKHDPLDSSPPEKTEKDDPPDSEEAIGRALIHDSENGNVLGQLSRYETSLNNSLARTLSVLKTLQSARGDRGQAEASKTVA